MHLPGALMVSRVMGESIIKQKKGKKIITIKINEKSYICGVGRASNGTFTIEFFVYLFAILESVKPQQASLKWPSHWHKHSSKLKKNDITRAALREQILNLASCFCESGLSMTLLIIKPKSCVISSSFHSAGVHRPLYRKSLREPVLVYTCAVV